MTQPTEVDQEEWVPVKKAPPTPRQHRNSEWVKRLQAIADLNDGEWYSVAEYDSPASAYVRAADLRKRGNLPAGTWEFAGRRMESGAGEVFAKVSINGNSA